MGVGAPKDGDEDVVDDAAVAARQVLLLLSVVSEGEEGVGGNIGAV